MAPNEPIVTHEPMKIVTDPSVLEKELGPGPMRFFPKGERSIQEQREALDEAEKKCCDDLKKKWQQKYPKLPFSDEMFLRFARCSPGSKKFNEKESWKVMKKFDHRFLCLSAEGLEGQLLSKTLFPLPGLMTKEGHDCFYMMPARYFPQITSTEEIIDNLAYCMQVMLEKEKACNEGIGFIANMNNWKMANFSVSYCYQFMMMLQGKVPVRVRLFLIINPPGWFGAIWKIMKPMLAPDFRKKVHMIAESDLSKFLGEGHEKYLPTDLTNGKLDADELLQDFVTYCKRVEQD